jgi:hypothetical protein
MQKNSDRERVSIRNLRLAIKEPTPASSTWQGAIRASDVQRGKTEACYRHLEAGVAESDRAAFVAASPRATTLVIWRFSQVLFG